MFRPPLFILSSLVWPFSTLVPWFLPAFLRFLVSSQEFQVFGKMTFESHHSLIVAGVLVLLITWAWRRTYIARFRIARLVEAGLVSLSAREHWKHVN